MDENVPKSHSGSFALDIFPDHLKDSSGRNKTQCSMRLFMFIHPSIYQAFCLSFSVLLRCQHRQLYPRNKPCISSASNHGLQRHHSNTTVYSHRHAKKKKKNIIWRDCKCLNIQKWEYKNVASYCNRKIIIAGETRSRLDPSNTQSIPCGACK